MDINTMLYIAEEKIFLKDLIYFYYMVELIPPKGHECQNLDRGDQEQTENVNEEVILMTIPKVPGIHYAHGSTHSSRHSLNLQLIVPGIH